MSSDFNCGLCFSSSVQLTNSIDESVFVLFFNLIPSIKLCQRLELSKKVCQLCYGKAKICNDFVAKINESQEKFHAKIKKRQFETTVEQASTAEIIKKMQKYSGISIKKVEVKRKTQKSEETVVCSEEEPDDLLEEVMEPTHSYDDENECFSISEEDSDEDFKPSRSNKSKVKTTKSPVFKKNGIFIDAPVNFTCAKCKQSFFSFEVLSEHMKTKLCFTEIISCKECGKEFKNKKNLYSHSQIHKKKEKVMCEACAREFNSQFDLDSHIEATHRRVVKKDCVFRCTHCQETFESHLDLLVHVKQHNQEKKDAPRLCEICAKVCANQKSYLSHMSTHRNQKSFVCKICKKGFSKSFQLTQHFHIHSGIKAFSCDTCQRSYAKRESLRVHKKKEHFN